MKKALIILSLAITLTGCTSQPYSEIESNNYVVPHSRYYTDGTIETSDGMLWGYETETISNIQPYNGMPVFMCMNDNGTPEIIKDDIVLGLVFDRETAIYDALATSFDEGNIQYERNGNIIAIQGN